MIQDGRPRRTRILVVDDDPKLLHRIDLALQDQHDLATTASWRAAPDLAREFRPKLIMLDVVLGQSDSAGFELLDQLKLLLPDVDVILMTGYKTLGDRLMQALQKTAFYYLQKPFGDEELCAIVERCLSQRWLLEEYHIGQRYKREVEDARALQAGLVPAKFPNVGRLSLSCRYKPRFRLGGDFADYAVLDGSRVALILADIAGHGLAPAMLTAVVKSAFHSSNAEDFAPDAVVHRVSESLAQCTETHFVTLVAMRIDPDNEVLEYVNAGHPSPYKWGVDWPPVPLTESGPMISPMPELRSLPHVKQVVPFVGSERLLLLTDGMLDLRGPDDFFGATRVVEQIARWPMGGEVLLDELISAGTEFSAEIGQEDDVTLVSVSFL
jgi:serine phosphatase RsbU (regulator of sigma subunit)